MSTILVVEDEQKIREDICTVLEFEGFQTIGASNGKVGLEKIHAQLPDLICCDILMPEMDGYEFIKQLRANPQYVTIPFVFLSAKTSNEDVKKGLEAGATAYLKKPFNTTDLLNLIGRLLNT